eukprot:gene1935-2265_t
MKSLWKAAGWLAGWKVAHASWGFLTLLLGIINCFMGVGLMHGLGGWAWSFMLASLCLLLGALLVAAVALEVLKARRAKPSHPFPSTECQEHDLAQPYKQSSLDHSLCSVRDDGGRVFDNQFWNMGMVRKSAKADRQPGR